jgi:glycosyltransferase involved in cell wall biosynthesis
MNKQVQVVLLSVGSYAKTSDLVYSQMLKLGDFVEDENEFFVKSFIYLPISSCIKRFRQVLSDRKEIKSNTNHEVHFGLTPIRWAGAFSFFFRNFFTRLTVSHLEKVLFKDLDENIPVIFNCRNYYSVFVALQLKARQTRTIRVVFDTRGLMPFEVPFISRLGSLLYGPFHRWEHELIIASDVVLVQAQKSKEYLELVHGDESNIKYLPISGFSKILRQENLDSRFNSAWNKKQFLYVGSLGHWNDFETLLKSFSLIASAFDEEIEFLVAATEQNFFSKTNLPFKINFTSVSYDSIHHLYNESLALIVGGSTGDDFFSQANMRLNYFSTKAVEALSLGVPLLVNDDLTELAAFVGLNNCGYTFSIEDKAKNDKSDLWKVSQDKQAWELISKNAAKTGDQFLKESVHSDYSKVWRELI